MPLATLLGVSSSAWESQVHIPLLGPITNKDTTDRNKDKASCSKHSPQKLIKSQCSRPRKSSCKSRRRKAAAVADIHFISSQQPEVLQAARMKFGKRLAAEAARRWSNYYFDYKAIKKAIKDDIQSQDAHGTVFQKVLLNELNKVSCFYSQKAQALEATLAGLNSKEVDSGKLAQLRAEVQELIKFVALNYLAVVKAIKKRNRHLKENFGENASTSLQAVDLLGQEVFFTSPRLAVLATQAEVLASELTKRNHQQAEELLQDYQCPICLDTLHSPVVLTCAHRFCWGCLVAHTTSNRTSQMHMPSSSKEADVFTPAATYRMLEEIARLDEQDQDTQKFYNCPVCRKPQIMDVDSLQVDTFLTNFIEGLRAITSAAVESAALSLPLQPSHQSLSAASAPVPIPKSVTQPAWGIIPPQAPEHQGKLTVLLDIDGTLVSSFTPRRAPRLPPYVRTHLVGVGSKLNPQGVFVVERPGLRQFLEELSSFAEVIVFTAGLEDYAKPIIDALDPQGTFFAGRIYREGTVKTEYYQCVKDMARLGRDLRRTVLVDDTPLAFLHQPENGIPVLGFRGDPDDRLLNEAVLPLLQALVPEDDVRSVLQRRFDMSTWFKRNGFPVEHLLRQAEEAVQLEKLQATQGRHATSSSPPHSPSPRPLATTACTREQSQPSAASLYSPSSARGLPAPTKDVLLLVDFDRTLTDFDAGERVIEQLAPELLASLVSLDQPANFIPITNTLLAELHRRGVSRDKLLQTLQDLGASEFPAASAELLRQASLKGVDTCILSDCNSVFITNILAGAKVSDCVQQVLTNQASFERVADCSEQTVGIGCSPSSKDQQQGQRPAGAHKLVIQPFHATGTTPHGCKLCPVNLCKGSQVRQVKQQNIYKRIVFCGDGANDICPALELSSQDVVLARAGHALAEFCLCGGKSRETRMVQAEVKLWSTHEELLMLAQQYVRL